MAIMLILTLTISAFNLEAEGSDTPVKVAGDYSAVFPLLVVSVFLSLMTSRDTIFYATQRARGDISAVPEVLCQPGMEGSPLVVGYIHGSSDEISYDDNSAESDVQEMGIEVVVPGDFLENRGTRTIDAAIVTQNDIETAFADATSRGIGVERKPTAQGDNQVLSKKVDGIFAASYNGGYEQDGLSSSRLDELLGIFKDADNEAIPLASAHRRIHSAPFAGSMVPSRPKPSMKGSIVTVPATVPQVVGNHGRTNSSSSQKGVLVRVTSFGDIQDHQPSLMEQARMWSASTAAESRHRGVPSLPNAPPQAPREQQDVGISLSLSGESTARAHRRIPSSGRHSRKLSDTSQLMLNMTAQSSSEPGGALSIDDIEHSFSAVVNEKVRYDAFSKKSLWSTK
jgi:hypothetical protein